MKTTVIARWVALGALVVIGAGALAYSYFSKNMSTSTAVSTQTSQLQTSTTQPEGSQSAPPSGSSSSGSSGAPSGSASSQEFKDGTYTAVGSYISPGGDEKLSVTVTLKDDVITAASMIPEPVSSEGQHFQGLFAANFQSLVVGKNITDVHLSEVSGSSLTSGGFNEALQEIETQAKA